MTSNTRCIYLQWFYLHPIKLRPNFQIVTEEVKLINWSEINSGQLFLLGQWKNNVH